MCVFLQDTESQRGRLDVVVPRAVAYLLCDNIRPQYLASERVAPCVTDPLADNIPQSQRFCSQMTRRPTDGYCCVTLETGPKKKTRPCRMSIDRLQQRNFSQNFYNRRQKFYSDAKYVAAVSHRGGRFVNLLTLFGHWNIFCFFKGKAVGDFTQRVRASHCVIAAATKNRLMAAPKQRRRHDAATSNLIGHRLPGLLSVSFS